jgi:ferredoxin
MDALRAKAKTLLESGAVKVVIGYAAGSTPERVRPVFVRTAADAQQLVWPLAAENAGAQNLATYVLKPEVKALGKAAVVASKPALKTLLQYAAENQLPDESFVALAVGDGGAVRELSKLAELEEVVATLPHGIAAKDAAEIARLDAMSREERWKFWYAELSRCIKCYACRAACPLCYCTKCITETNQPQWVPVSSDAFGNLEWNVVRAMHLAGRCIDCGSCATACPENIRIDLLNHVLATEALQQFGAEAGLSTRKEYALSSFKPDDKEEFIR